jgi:hypothetical protein
MGAVKKADTNRVVARFNDGKLLKGYTYDFTPLKDTFYLSSRRERKSADLTEVRVDSLKAIFFVKTLEGDPDYEEKTRFDEVKNPTLKGLKIRVRFFDGEVIRGMTQGYSKNRKGFFLFPVDPQSNNDRIYVVANAVEDVKVGSAAEEEEAAEISKPTPAATSELPPQESVEKAPPATCPYLEITGGEKDRVIELGEKELIIGRGAKCGIRLSPKTVSRQHATLSLRNGEYHIEDLGSANGTYINGKKVTKHVLKSNDKLDIGGVKMVFHAGS